MALISNFVIFSLFFSLLYFIGLLTFITDYEENKCQMTYMFEYPQFVKIDLRGSEKYPRYGLYAYSEGRFTEKVRSMKFDGIPVLFVPGNAGSFKQVRSLASVALRKAINSRSKFHFDFFSVDLNGELSALNGALLEDQASFVNESIYRVLDLYSDSEDVPKSVVLIGHSMGGVIAHSVMLNSGDKVNLLLSMASPHHKPSISLDYYTTQFYDSLQTQVATMPMVNKTFVTIGGGNFDHLVHSWLTNVNSTSLNVVTTAIPTVWLSTDHQCIMWCKQLILTIIRALFDSVDLNTKQISLDHRLRLAAFKYHLLTNSGINLQQASKYKMNVRFDTRGDWNEDLRRQYSVAIPNKNQIQYLMIRLFDDPKYQVLHIRVDNMMYPDWIYLCSADVIQGSSRICEEGIHLSHRSELTPSLTNLKGQSRMFNIDMFKLKKRFPDYSHVIVRVLPQPEPGTVHFDIHTGNERRITVDLPSWYTLNRNYIMRETPKKHMRYTLEMPALQHVIQTYLLYIEPISCDGPTSHSSGKLYVPWANHDTHVFINEETKKPLLIRLYNSKPAHVKNSTAKVILNLDPTCQYSISIRNSLVGTLSQFARYYSTMLVSNIAAVVLVTYYSQMNNLQQNAHCSIFQAALSVDTKPYYLVTAAKLISRTAVVGRFGDIFPKPDGQYLLDENMDFFFLPLMLYVIAVGLTYAISVALWSTLILSESTVHKLAAKGVTKTFGGAVKLSDWFLNALHKVPCIVGVTLVCLGLSTCGGMALTLGLVYYFLKLTQMCQEYVEGLVYGFLRKASRKFIGLFSRKKDDESTVVADESKDDSEPEPEPVVDTDDKKIENDSSFEDLNAELCENSESGDKNEEHDDNHSEPLEIIEDEEIEQLTETENEAETVEATEDVSETEEKTDELRLRKMQLEKFNGEGSKEEEKPKADEDKPRKKDNYDAIHFHFTLFLLWFLVTLINIPVVLTWARNFHYSNVLRPDPSIIPGLVMTICAAFLWQFEIPKPNKLYYKEVGMFLYFMALLCLIYAPIHIYRLTYMLMSTVVVVTIHQLFGPEREVEAEPEVDDLLREKDPVERMEEMKTKME